MRRLKSCLLILVALWLPLQAAASAAMPFCRHAAEQVAADAAHCHEAADVSSAAAAGDCDNCAICHLATAGYLPATATRPIAEPAGIPQVLQVPAPPTHIGDPPRYPPRRTS